MFASPCHPESSCLKCTAIRSRKREVQCTKCQAENLNVNILNTVHSIKDEEAGLQTECHAVITKYHCAKSVKGEG